MDNAPVLAEQEMSESPQAWIAAELAGVELGDKRLNWRLVDTASKLAAQPTASIPQACDDWADTRATYRLFDNTKVSAEQIQAPHYERTRSRLAAHPRVLAVQDTTYLDFTAHAQTQGLGPIGTEQQQMQGLVMHTALFLTPSGLPLGLGSQQLWVRPDEPNDQTQTERRKQPIEEKESYKWLMGLTQTLLRVPAGTQVVHVGDSEADIYELFVQAQTHQTDLLVRAAQNRRVSAPEVGLLWDQLAAQPIQGSYTVEVPQRQQQPVRTAMVSVRFAPVTLTPPQRLRGQLPSVSLWAVLVREETPPAGADAVEWLLLTTVAVHTLADALERIDWYCQRWQIEVYHKILKSGCRVEASQLATAARLMRLIALYSIIAWRLFWLTHLYRHEPQAPCTTVLADHEWRALFAHTHRSPQPPAQLPSVADVVLWIARLGGFLARRHDGPPGVTVIWRGWQRLHDIASTWLLFHPPPTCG